MLTEIEKIELPKKVLELYESGNLLEATKMIHERWLIFPHLPEQLRDNDDIAYAAVTGNMQIWHKQSPRLINDINFFISTFNKTNQYSIYFAAPKDMLFMTEYAYHRCHLHYLIPPDVVLKRYNVQNPDKDINDASKLIELIKNWKQWFRGEILGDEVKCVCFLHNQVPGFKLFTYAYAYKWAYHFVAMEERAKYV
jgi:hypothetical protein